MHADRPSQYHVLTVPCPSQTEKYTTLGAISGLAWSFLTAWCGRSGDLFLPTEKKDPLVVHPVLQSHPLTSSPAMQ